MEQKRNIFEHLRQPGRIDTGHGQLLRTFDVHDTADESVAISIGEDYGLYTFGFYVDTCIQEHPIHLAMSSENGMFSSPANAQLYALGYLYQNRDKLSEAAMNAVVDAIIVLLTARDKST